jgi:hypothetical protein
MRKKAIRRGTDFTVTIGLNLETRFPVIARLDNIKPAIRAIT